MATPNSSRLLTFYRGGRDDRGRSLTTILGWDRAQLESVHDFIQWLFPLPEASSANPGAPVLTPEDMDAFRREPELQERMRGALATMLGFYGIDPPGAHVWLTVGNHNYRRLTRMLRSLRAVGLEAEAQRLFTALQAIYNDHQGVIGRSTFEFWRRAATETIAA